MYNKIIIKQNGIKPHNPVVHAADEPMFNPSKFV